MLNKLNKTSEKYFDLKFKNTKLGTISNYDNVSDDDWFGFILNGCIILGVPLNEKERQFWFYDGLYFSDGPKILGLPKSDFREQMLFYVENKYPELDIRYLA